MTEVRDSDSVHDKHANDNPPDKIEEQRSDITQVMSLIAPRLHLRAPRCNGWVLASPDYGQISEVACNPGLRIVDPTTQRYTQHHRTEPGGLVKSR